ncbi:hypothetical protein JCM8547_001400 [Rhodosporidiobolus lusitaniae]
MADQEYPAENGRSPSPSRGARARSRSRSPVRMQEDRRDGGDRGRSDARGSGGGGNPGNNLHVSGLSTRAEERDLEELFSKHGRIEKCQVMRDPHTKESRGFAFVTMETADDAEAAITALNATELLGRTINVEKARRGRARTPTPGQYHGPPKRYEGGFDRPYGGRGGDRFGGGYRDDYRGGGRGYDDRDRGGYRDDYRGGSRYDDRDRGGYAIPMRGDSGRGGGYDDRRRDDRRSYDDRRY